MLPTIIVYKAPQSGPAKLALVNLWYLSLFQTNYNDRDVRFTLLVRSRLLTVSLGGLLLALLIGGGGGLLLAGTGVSSGPGTSFILLLLPALKNPVGEG